MTKKWPLYAYAHLCAVCLTVRTQDMAAIFISWGTHEGPDGIHYHMPWHLPFSSLSFLLAIFNNIWTDGNLPPHWLESLPTFCKPNKSGILPQDYRPIALTSCLCKLLERMVNLSLMWYLDRIWILSCSKHSRSTYTFWNLHIFICKP